MDEEIIQGEEAEEKDEKSISSDLIRGHINTIILRALYDGDKYGYEIIAEIERKSHGQYSLKQPSLYSALKRLEKEGFVTSYWGGSVGGGRRKYFSLTDAGKEISEHNQSEWEYSRTVIDSLISDKDFDFSNPAPSVVNMRVLRSSTSRVPSLEGEEEEFDYEPEFEDAETRNRLNEEFEQKNAALEEEYEKKNAALGEEYEKKNAALEEERRKFEEEMQQRAEAMRSEQSWRERELSERERVISEERQEIEQLRSEHQQDAEAEEAQRAAEVAEETERRRLLDEEETARRQAFELEEAERRRALDEEETERRRLLEEETERRKEQDAERERKLNAHEQELNERESFYTAERNRFAELLRQRDEQLEEERRKHALDLEEQEKRILAEQENLLRQREQQLLHQNYLDLVSTPPSGDGSDYGHYTVPVAEPETPAPTPLEAAGGDYRAVVQNIYAGTVRSENGDKESESTSLDGIDFRDLQSRASRDGIRVTTAGGTFIRRKPEESDSLVHKGKALFLSAIVVFCLCIVEGSITLGIRKTYSIPVYYPYFIWCIGLAVLLITGLAFANRYGERSLRRNGPVLINAFVAYALLIIVTLIVALAARIDFKSATDLATFIIIPVIFFFGVVVFGICYYFLTRPKKNQ